MPMKPVDQAIKIILGPCIDDTDFKTREEALTYNQAGMEIDVIVEKSDGTIVTTAVTPTTAGDYDWSHTDQGYYELELPASGGVSFNNTEEGQLTVVGFCTGVLPFRSVTYDIVTLNTYNSFIKGNDLLDVSIEELQGSNQSLTDLKDFADAGYDPATNKVEGVKLVDTATTLTNKTGFSLSSTGLDAIASTATGMVEIAKAIWDRVLTGGTHNINNSAGKRLRIIDASFEVHSGTAQAGSTASTFVMDTGADGTNNDIYRGDRIVITGGTGVNEHGIIISYVASTRVATMSENWVVTPDNTSEFTVVPADVDLESWNHNSVTGDGDWATLQANVTTLLGRITSTLFSGITSLAEWLGAMAGAQTANATAKTEIQATGAGSGTYNETTDSQEAVRNLNDSTESNAIAILSDTADMQPRFTGITKLAEWLGLLAGKQVADATALAEIKATGAGSGTYDESADSQEAIRDRGDSAWVTGSGGDATEAKQDTIIANQGTQGLVALATEAKQDIIDSNIDKLREILYKDGVYVNIDNGSAGTTDYVNGTILNPSGNIADAKTLATSLGIKEFYLIGKTGFTLTGGGWNTGQRIRVEDTEAVIDLGTEAVDELLIIGGRVNAGASPSASIDPMKILNTKVENLTLPPCRATDIRMENTITLQAGNYEFAGVKISSVSGTTKLDFDAAVGETNVVVSGLSGKLEILNMKASDDLRISGDGRVDFAASCTAGTARVSGAIYLEDNSVGTTVSDYTTKDNDAVDSDATLAKQNEIITDLDDIKGTGFAKDTDSLIDLAHQAGAKGTDNIFDGVDVLPIKRNVAIANFYFVMFDTNGDAVTGDAANITARVSKDGAAFGAIAGAISEIGLGVYKVALTATETDFKDGLYIFTSPNASATFKEVITESA